MAEQQKKPEASGSFDGIFTLKTREEAEELSLAVRGVIDASVDLFFTIDSDPHVKHDVETDLEHMKRLLAQFPSMCMTPETQKKGTSVVEDITTSANNIISVFREHVDGNKLTPEQENKIRASLQKIMFDLISVTELMEDLQRIRCLRMVSNGLRHLQIFRDTTSSYRIDEKLASYVRDMKQLLGALRERSEVLGGGSEFDQLSRTVGEMEAVIPLLVKAMKAAVLEPSDANTAARDGHIRGQASCFQVVMQVLQNTYQASGAFDYTSLAESMAELEKAVQAGDREAATCQAKDIAQALRNRPDVDEDRLRDLLRQMVQLTKDGLAKPKDDTSDLSNVLSGMKQEVLTVEKKKAKSSNAAARMGTLLECAQNLSSGLREMESDLRN